MQHEGDDAFSLDCLHARGICYGEIRLPVQGVAGPLAGGEIIPVQRLAVVVRFDGERLAAGGEINAHERQNDLQDQQSDNDRRPFPGG